MKLNQNQYSGQDKEKLGRSTPGATYVAIDTRRIYVYDDNGIPRLASATGNGGGGSATLVDFYGDLNPGASEDSIAFVLQSQGTKWLPGSLGGTYRPAGWYIYRAGVWFSNRRLVDEELNDYGILIGDNKTSIDTHKANYNNPHLTTKTHVGLGSVDDTSDINKPISTATQTALDGKANTSHSHVKTDITDFNEADYAKPGDNISIFVNDQVYLQPGDNVSAFVNDAGYIKSKTIASFRSDFESGTVIYSGYLLDTVITIKKCDNGVITYAQSLTNLETDWTNRLSLTYI